MKKTDLQPLLLAVCEALYQLRSLGDKVRLDMARIHVPYARQALERAAAEYLDLGQTATTADCAKLLLSGRGDAGAAYTSARAEEKASADPVDTALRRDARARKLIEECLAGAQESDSSTSLFKTLGRFAEFCDRACYCRPFVDWEGKPRQPLMPDDPVLPVVPWLRARGIEHLPEDLPGAAELYLRWCEEAARKTPGALPHVKPRNPGTFATLLLVRKVVQGGSATERRSALRELLGVVWGSQLALLDAREALEPEE